MAGRQKGPEREGPEGRGHRRKGRERNTGSPECRSHAGLAHVRREERKRRDIPLLSCSPAPRLLVALQVRHPPLPPRGIDRIRTAHALILGSRGQIIPEALQQTHGNSQK